MDPFYCFLFNDVLVITVDRSAYFGPKYKFVNFLGNYASLRVDPSPSVPPPLAEKADQFHFFELRFPRSSYMLAVKTEKEKEEWVNHLEGVVGEGFGKEMFGLGLGLGLGEGAGAEIQNDLLEGARCEGVLMKQSVYLKKWNERYCLIRGTTFFMAMKEGEAAYTKIDLERFEFCFAFFSVLLYYRIIGYFCPRIDEGCVLIEVSCHLMHPFKTKVCLCGRLLSVK